MLPSNSFSSNNCFPPLSAGMVLVKFWQGHQVLWCCPPEDGLFLTPFLFFFIHTYPSFISLLQLVFALASQPILLFFFFHGKHVAFSMSQHLRLVYVVFAESVLFWEANKLILRASVSQKWMGWPRNHRSAYSDAYLGWTWEAWGWSVVSREHPALAGRKLESGQACPTWAVLLGPEEEESLACGWAWVRLAQDCREEAIGNWSLCLWKRKALEPRLKC